MDPTIDADEAAAMSLLLTDEPLQQDETPDPDTPEEDDAQEEQPDDAQVDEAASEDEAEEQEASEEPQLFTVKVDGVEKRVTLEELTRSFSGVASIQRRIQEAEAERKQALAIRESLASELQRVSQMAQTLQNAPAVAPPQPPDPRMLDQNPVAYLKAKATYESNLQAFQRDQADRQAAAVYTEQRQRVLTMQAQEQYLAEQARALADAIPDFAKPETAAAARDRLLKAGEHYGYTVEELGAVMDARAVRLLHDAAKYRELQARKTEARKPPTQTARHVPPAAKRQPEPPQLARAKKIEAARRSGDPDAWAALLLEPQKPSR